MKIFSTKTKNLEDDIQKYLDVIGRTLLLFPEAIAEYLDGETKHFEKHLIDASECEHEADAMQRSITFRMFRYMLLPESQGDVLELIAMLDDIPDTAKMVLEKFDLEQPFIPAQYHSAMKKLAQTSVKTADALMQAVNAFFTDDLRLRDFISKVLFFEHETDQLQNEVLKSVFQDDNKLDLALKNQIRYFCEKIAFLSDTAENISDKLMIYSAKRML